MSYSSTRHAAERWQQRIDPKANLHGAGFAMTTVLHSAVAIPNRHAVAQWGHRTSTVKAKRHRREGLRYIYHPRALFLTKNKVVVTVLATDDDDIATVLTWLLTGCWVEGET